MIASLKVLPATWLAIGPAWLAPSTGPRPHRCARPHTWDDLYRRTALTTQIYNAQGVGLYDFRQSFSYDDLSRVTRVRQYSVSGGASLTDKRDIAWNAVGARRFHSVPYLDVA